MAKRNNEDEDEFEGIRPGDIDDVFELDDEGFDIETDSPNDEESYLDDEENDETDYDEYMYGNESETNDDENPDVEVEEESKEELIEDMIDTETAQKSVESENDEVSIESIKKEFINSKINNEDELLDVLSELKSSAFDNNIEIPSVEVMKDRTMEYLNEKGYIPVDDPKAIDYIFSNEDNVQVEPESEQIENSEETSEVTEEDTPNEEQPEMGRPMIDDDPEELQKKKMYPLNQKKMNFLL